MEATFKKATSNDMDVLLKLIKELYQLENIPFNYQILVKCLGEVFSNEQLGMVWLICMDDEAIGYIVLTFGYSFEFHGRDALVDELYIRENYRGQGIGTKALKFVENICESMGITAVHLVVSYQNKRAKSVYEKVGFVEHDRYIMTDWIN